MAETGCFHNLQKPFVILSSCCLISSELTEVGFLVNPLKFAGRLPFFVAFSQPQLSFNSTDYDTFSYHSLFWALYSVLCIPLLRLILLGEWQTHAVKIPDRFFCWSRKNRTKIIYRHEADKRRMVACTHSLRDITERVQEGRRFGLMDGSIWQHPADRCLSSVWNQTAFQLSLTPGVSPWRYCQQHYHKDSISYCYCLKTGYFTQKRIMTIRMTQKPSSRCLLI